MAGRFGEVCVMDWGLAKVIGRPESAAPLEPSPPRAPSDIGTRTEVIQTDRESGPGSGPGSPLATEQGFIVGTPGYLAPEQARADSAAIGPRTDVYALGAMLYHLLAGHMPFVPIGARLNNYAVWSAVQQGPPPSIQSLAPDAPAELAAICERAMAREIGERYPDMSALLSLSGLSRPGADIANSALLTPSGR
jgi:serine/threonine-protein kinase